MQRNDEDHERARRANWQELAGIDSHRRFLHSSRDKFVFHRFVCGYLPAAACPSATFPFRKLALAPAGVPASSGHRDQRRTPTRRRYAYLPSLQVGQILRLLSSLKKESLGIGRVDLKERSYLWKPKQCGTSSISITQIPKTLRTISRAHARCRRSGASSTGTRESGR